MMKKVNPVFVLMITFALSVCVSDVVSATIYVPDDYPTIQAAVNATSAGGTIIVRDGTYNENVNVNKRLAIQSENGADKTIVQAKKSNDHVFEVTADYVNISGLTVKGAGDHVIAGIYLNSVDYCKIYNNNVNSNAGCGISLLDSSNNTVAENVANSNYDFGILLSLSSNNNIYHNIASNSTSGVFLSHSSNNNITGNEMFNNGRGIGIFNCSNHNIATNNISNNDYGIDLWDSSSNNIYFNNFMSRINNVRSIRNSTNFWNSTSKITYTYKGKTYTNYLGNYGDDYTDVDADNDGFWDHPYSIDADKDYHPLVEPFGNYLAPTEENIFDTGPGTYPSISGTHEGTIKPTNNILVHTLYTYPCPGTGGHTEYARIWNETLDVNATWNGYVGNGHNISFNEPFMLVAGEMYNYSFRTGSYPQIHRESELQTDNGWLNCTHFTDANGKKYDDGRDTRDKIME